MWVASFSNSTSQSSAVRPSRIHFTDEETNEQEIQRLKVLQNLNNTQTSTQIVKLFWFPPILCSTDLSILDCQQAKAKGARSEKSDRFQTAPRPTTMDALGRASVFKMGKSRAVPGGRGAGVKAEGQPPDPRSTSCSFLPSPHATPSMAPTPSTKL